MPTTPNNTTASQHAGRSRRGSALIITVGTLALIAVIAAFYVTLGQADSRVSEGVERSASVRKVETQVADHIAKIIAIDRTATTIETLSPDENDVGGTFDSNGNPVTPDAADRQRFVREATDYPFTDFSYKSIFVIPDATLGEGDMGFEASSYANTPDVFDNSNRLLLAAAAERFRFRPAGDHTTMLDADGTLISSGDDQMLRDYRVASDPWLAASEPTFTGLGDPDNNPSTLPAERRVFSVDAFFRSNIPGARLDELTYLDNRDWAQISNLAPDGLSINLWNLRGNFDAESGLGTDPDGRARMSENRTLLTLDNPTGGTPETDYQIRASDRLHFDPDGDIVPSFLANTPEAFAIRNTPAWWTMNQRFLYFPADRDFQILGRPDAATSPSTSTVIQTWGTPDFPDYQYADADGDGFYDSRWFELADSTLGRLGSHSLLENETNLRFVVAARVIDLSARVNVNSATDGLVPPTSDVPAGATPAEIDLRRLLTGQDAAEQYRPVFANTDNTINDDDERLSYAHIRRLAFNDRQENNPGRLIAGDYEDYLTSRDFTAAVEPRITVLTGPGLSTGRFAYDALRRELQGDELYLPSLATNLRAPDDAGNPYTTPLSLKDGSPFEYFNYNGLVANQDDKLYPTSPIFGTDVVFGTWTFAGENAASLRALPRWRRDSWFDIGGVNIADPDALSETKLGLGARPFGLDDLAELLAFNGVNDDRVLSRLERVTQGRYDASNILGTDIADSTIRFGPLRANRPTSLERTNHDTRTNRDAPSATQFPVPDNLIDDEPFILNAINPRLRLTTISGAAPLRSRVVEDVDGDGVLSAAERRLTSLDARLDLMPSDVVVNENSSISGTSLSVTGINTFGRDDTPDGSFVRDGFTVGMEIFARGFDDPANNGRFTVTAVTDDVLTVAEDLEVETQGPGREIAQLSDAERPERLFTYYADALAPYSEIDATWNNNPEGADAGFGAASQLNYPRMRTLAYGYRGSELALRLSAHLALNMADMVDADDEPLAYTVIASPRNDVRRNLNTQWPNTLGDRNPYVWWNDGNRLDLGEGGDADDKLAPREQDVNTDFSRIAYNAYGVEAQPVITEVSVLTVYTDVPRAPIGVASIANGFDGTVMTEDESVGDYPGFNEEDADQTVNPDDPDEYQPSDPSDDGSDDDITIRADISPENPDLVAHVLAIQLTNPFDVPIELSGADTSPNPLADGGALNTQNNLQLEAVKYYIEFNGHFFPLAEFFERAANINPATGFGGGPGPTAFQRYQVMRTDIGEQNRTQTNKLYGVTLQPGESRVFYVSAHPWIEGMNRRWREIDSVYGDVAGGDDVGDSGVLEAPVTDRDNRNLFEEFISAQYTVRRADGQPQHMELISADTHNSPGALFRADTREPVRLVPFDPRSGELAPAGQGGAFVDFLRTSAAVRVPNSDPEADRMRQEVRLWRRMTNEDSSNFTAVTEEKEIFENGTPTNLIENDLLVDRMRDPMLPLETSVQTGATVDFAVFNETQRQEIVNRPATEFLSTINSSAAPPADWTTAVNETIPNTTSTDDNNGQWSNTSQGLTIVRFAGYRRPDHLAANPTPGEDAEVVRLRGLLPAWATESREMNYNIAIPTMLEVDRDTDGDGSPDDPALGTVPPALEALDNIMTADILDSSLGGEMVGWQNNEGFVQDSDHDPYYSRNLRSMMLKAMPPNEINTEDENTLIFDHWSLVPSIARHPDYKVEPDVFQADPFNFATATRSGLNAAGEIRPNGPYTPSVLNTEERTVGTNFPSYMNDRQSLLFNTSDRFGFDGDEPRTTRIRVGDILAPLAVGPTFAPRLTLGTPWPWDGPANFRPGDWTTLAEALSAALGLEPPAFYNKDPNDIGYSLLSELVELRSIGSGGVNYDAFLNVNILPSEELGPMVDSRVEFVLDNGRLHLGEYTPFYNGNLGVNHFNVVDGTTVVNPSWGSVTFNPTEAGNTGINTDRRVAFSVPPAQRLLSMVQGVHRGGDFLTTPVIGTVNINTATDPVLRTIPGLATSMQFSESKVDYDQYDVDENHDGTTDVTSLATNGRLMEWVPGRVGARSHLFTNPFDPDDIALREPMAFGLGNPFELNGQFAGDGWRNVGEAAPSVLGIRDRTASIFRRAAKRPGGGSGSEGILNGIGAQGAGVAPEIIFDFTPDAQFVNSYAFGPDAFGAGSSSAAQRMRDLMATNFDLDYGRAAINGQTAASERPGFSGIGSLLGLDVPYYEPLSDKTIYEIRNPKIQARVAADANGLFPLWFRTRPTDLPINRIQVRGETLQGTMTRLGNDYLDSDDADFTDDFDNVRAGRALSAMNQDRNGIADPDGDGNEILRSHAVEDGYDPIIDPIEDDNYSYTLGRAFFGNENSDDDLRPNVLEDELANDLLEELAIFNGAANTIDTRSDFFAAWFVLRGYSQNDVSGLDPEEPMTPSYQKRFLMVIDRSNVTDAGQSPRILYFGEVPL